MTSRIINGAPMVLPLGTEDKSKVLVAKQTIPLPQHMPKQFIYAADGPTTPEPCNAVKRLMLYGADTFKIKGNYYNHSTMMADGMNAEGNIIMYQRVIPDDAGPRANVTLWMDVLETNVVEYVRNADGSIATNITSDPIPKTTLVNGVATPVMVPGFKVKFVRSVSTSKTSSNDPMSLNFGMKTQKAGSQTEMGVDPVTGDPIVLKQSTLHPIYELEVPFQTSMGNNVGHRLMPVMASTDATYIEKFIATNKALPYAMQVIERATATASPTFVKTLYGEQNVTVAFKAGAVDPVTEDSIHASDVFVQSYQNLLDARYELFYGKFGTMHVYQDEIDSLLTSFHAAEADRIVITDPLTPANVNYDKYDFTSDTSDKYLFNMFTGRSTKGYVYHSMIFVNTGADVVEFGPSSNIYNGGGSDGTMTNLKFDELVTIEMDRYLDETDSVQNLAWNTESIFYDSGFGMDAKFSLLNAIAVRKDTKVVLGTFISGEPVLTLADEQARAILLRTAARQFPESSYFGTPTCRAEIYPFSGLVRSSAYKPRMPMTYEIGCTFAAYMGSSNGKWNTVKDPEGQPGNVIKRMYDIRHVWIPDATRTRFWDIGLNFVLTEDRETFFWPAFKTVYDDDTSVLNNSLVTMAICTLNKIAHACWRQYTGVSKYTDPLFLRKINDFVTSKSSGIFDGRYTIIPDAGKTEADVARGFSWVLPIKLGARSQNTVMTTYVQAWREADLLAAK